MYWCGYVLCRRTKGEEMNVELEDVENVVIDIKSE
jgi:hypothetical protein